MNYSTQTPVELTDADVIAAKHAWVINSQIHCSFADADEYVAYLRGQAAKATSKPAALAPTAPTKATAPATRARMTAHALVQKIGRKPTDEEIWRAMYAVLPSLRERFSSADQYVRTMRKGAG